MADEDEVADVNEFGLAKPCDGNSVKLPTGYIVLFVIFIVVRVFTMGMSGYLSWTCGIDSTDQVRAFVTSFAILFSEIYLIYFLVNTVIGGNEC